MEQNLETSDKSQKKEATAIVLHSLFVIPFIIVAVSLLFYTSMRILTKEKRGVKDYLDDLKGNDYSKKWRSAFELAKILESSPSIARDTKFVSEMISILESTRDDRDHRLRQYLALAMGKSQNSEFVPPLIESLQREKDDETRCLVIYALGMLKDKRAVSVVENYLEHINFKVRLASVIALGNIGDTTSQAHIKKRLTDANHNVQWDAAIALAKMGDRSGVPILQQILDRKYFAKFPDINEKEQSRILIIAIQTAALLKDPLFAKPIAFLKNDPDIHVRKTALNTLQIFDLEK